MHKYKWSLKVLSALLLIISLVVFANIENQKRKVTIEDITITNRNRTQFVSKQLVKEVLNSGTSAYAGSELGSVSVAFNEALLRKNAFIDSAEFAVKPNGKTIVSVTQEEAIARVNNGKEEFYINETAERIPMSSNFSAKVLLVTGRIKTEELEKVSQLCNYITQDSLLNRHISGIHKQNRKTFILSLYNSRKIIEFGEITHIDEKFYNLKVFYGSKQYKNTTYNRINLRFLNQVITSKIQA